MLRFLVDEVRQHLRPQHVVGRFDGAFFRREILEYLEASGVEYGIKAVYRKHVSHRSRKNFQLDFFDPGNGHRAPTVASGPSAESSNP